jgi:phosphohistidine phosphatase
MKILTLLRHAKSGWDDPVARDFDRPLNPRGRRAARTIGREMKAQGLAFDLVMASPARRVIETLEEVAAAYGAPRPGI